MGFTLHDNGSEHWQDLPPIPINGEPELVTKLREFQAREPFIAMLVAPNQDELAIGLGGPVSFVQFTQASRMPPYLCVFNPTAPVGGDPVEFVCGGTPTPIPSYLMIPFEQALEVAVHFFRHGEIPKHVKWKSV